MSILFPQPHETCHLICRSFLAAICLLAFAQAWAGPVPGIDSIPKQPVEFPHPKHIDVFDAGNDAYYVTFRWKPDFNATHPAVAGDFNGWSKTELPLQGPDAAGNYFVTAKIPGGDRQYKFVDGERWEIDPLNGERSADGRNSMLRLGITAIVRGLRPTRGDGHIELRAVLHDPKQVQFMDVFSPTDVIIRLRALKQDIERTTLTMHAQNGAVLAQAMRPAGSDALFDYFETHVDLASYNQPEDAGGRPGVYSFTLGDGTSHTQLLKSWPLVLDTKSMMHTPEWAANAIWYQVMIDRFRDGDPTNNPEYLTSCSTQRNRHTNPWTSNYYTVQPWEHERPFYGDQVYRRLYGGDFSGLIDKLDYIKSLGANAIYCCPVFESVSSHKYNARDYAFADDGYGKAGEFDRIIKEINLADPKTWKLNESDKLAVKLIAETHQRGMHIIFDAVFNHLGDDAISFADVQKRLQQSPYAGWYDVTSWSPFKYVGWAGFSGLPQFRKDPAKGFADDTLIQHLYACTRKWMDPNGDGDPGDGIDGWRLDVPNEIPAPFWVGWRNLVKSINPKAYITGEIWDPADEWLKGDTFDAVMNYQFAKIAFRFFGNHQHAITATEFDQELARLRNRYPHAATYVMQNLYDSHDTDRWVSRLNNPDLDYDGQNRIQQEDGKNYNDKRPPAECYQRLKLMAVFQSTYVGAPMIWYGTEVGMYGADDPQNRMPMWWEDKMPYENPDYRIEPELPETFKQLFATRNSHQVLRTGDFLTLIAADGSNCYAYLRHSRALDHAMVTVLNNSMEVQTIDIPAPEPRILPAGFTNSKIIYGEAPTKIEAAETNSLRITIAPISGAIVQVQR
jgi:glycosidase